MTPLDIPAGYPSCAEGVMRFHLIYSGSLPASANKSKASDVVRIRKELSPQLERLWATHAGLKELREIGYKRRSNAIVQIDGNAYATPRMLCQHYPAYFDCMINPLQSGQKVYVPLVRESLHLTCELDILFLREQDPGALITQSGDIDGRIKTLLDALRMPDADEARRHPEQDGPFVLLENDSLVSRLDVDTDRLLTPAPAGEKEVHLVIGVQLNVLRVTEYNLCLL